MKIRGTTLVRLRSGDTVLRFTCCSSLISFSFSHHSFAHSLLMSSLSLRAWTQARQQDIQDAYDDTHSWTALDEITRTHNYKFNSIAAWPLDACLISTPTSQAAGLLGSLHAACNLESIKEELGVSITVVVTMCENEMNVHGAPPSWKNISNNRARFTFTVSWKTSQSSSLNAI